MITTTKVRPKSPDDLHPTARRILKAARRLLVTKGFDAVTFDAIAAACHVNKSATRYHFGSKSGLVEAMLDDLIREYGAPEGHLRPDMSHEERLDTFVENVRRMIDEIETEGYFDLLPHVVRTKKLRAAFAEGLERWFAGSLVWLDLDGAASPEQEASRLGLAQLAAAVGDGLCVQALAFGKAYDPGPALEIFRQFLESYLATAWGDVHSTDDALSAALR